MSAAALRNVQDAAYEKGASAAAASARSGPSPFLKRAHFLSKGVRLNLCRFTSKLIGLFNEMDEDHSGRLSPKEFFDGLSAANIGMSHDEFDQFARLLDKSGDGQIDYNELVEGLYQLSTEHESSLDSQFMPGGEMLPFPVEPPVSRDAAAKGIWPVATSPPVENYRRRDSQVSAGQPGLGGTAMSRRDSHVSAGRPCLGGTAMSRRDSHVSAADVSTMDTCPRCPGSKTFCTTFVR
jgi:hypothetical protein